MSIELLIGIFGGISAATAAYVAYLTLKANIAPIVMVYYEQDRLRPSVLSLVIENVGRGPAYDLLFSNPLPIDCFGLKALENKSSVAYINDIPNLSPGQSFRYFGGQIGGIKQIIGNGMEVTVSYKYKSPFGILTKSTQQLFVSVNHMGRLPSSKSAEGAIIDALGRTNRTTLHEIRDVIAALNKTIIERSSSTGEEKNE